jgi:hypothetical protein
MLLGLPNPSPLTWRNWAADVTALVSFVRGVPSLPEPPPWHERASRATSANAPCRGRRAPGVCLSAQRLSRSFFTSPHFSVSWRPPLLFHGRGLGVHEGGVDSRGAAGKAARRVCQPSVEYACVGAPRGPSSGQQLAERVSDLRPEADHPGPGARALPAAKSRLPRPRSPGTRGNTGTSCRRFGQHHAEVPVPPGREGPGESHAAEGDRTFYAHSGKVVLGVGVPLS